MQKLLSITTLTALLAAGCSSLIAPNHLTDLPLRYHNAESGLAFCLPARWRGYSVVIQSWDGETYSAALDKLIVVGHGQIIVLRHPKWSASAGYQDIPIVVFTRTQWDALHQGKLWPSLYAGGMMQEMWHNQKYVFAISSRYNADDSVTGWQEVAGILDRNCAANNMPHLYPE